APGGIREIRAHIGGAALDGDLVRRELHIEEAEAAGIGLAHPHQEIERRGLAGAVGADEAEDRAVGDGERQRPQAKFAEALFQAIDGDGRRGHERSPRSSSWRSSCSNSSSLRPIWRPKRMALRIASRAISCWAVRVTSAPFSAMKVPRPWRR